MSSQRPMQFLFDLWRRKAGGFLWGVPDAIYVDQDSIFKSDRVLKALAPERLGCTQCHLGGEMGRAEFSINCRCIVVPIEDQDSNTIEMRRVGDVYVSHPIRLLHE